MKKITLLSSLALAAFLAGCSSDDAGNSTEKSGEGLDTNIVTIGTGGKWSL